MLLKVIQFCIICLVILQDEALTDEMKELPEPLKPKTSIKISGEIWRYDGETFHVDLQEAENDREGDTPLHVSVRYGQNKLVFNSWINGEWGQEEVHQGLPGRNGRWKLFDRLGYDLIITTWDDYFHIYLNGKEYTFKYRMPKKDLEKIKFVAISGAFDVTSFGLERDVETPGYKSEYFGRHGCIKSCQK